MISNRQIVVIVATAFALGACASDGNSNRSWSVDYKSPLTTVKAKGSSVTTQPVEEPPKEVPK